MNKNAMNRKLQDGIFRSPFKTFSPHNYILWFVNMEAEKDVGDLYPRYLRPDLSPLEKKTWKARLNNFIHIMLV